MTFAECLAETPLSRMLHLYAWCLFGILALLLVCDLGQRVLCLALRLRRPTTFPVVPEPDIVIHLVHGTWAPKAGWAAPDGCSLMKVLSRELGTRAQFVTFEWSGVNSFSARASAARNLGAHVRSWRQRVPHARHLIVGHSHGGSIALAAVNTNDLATIVDSVVCLSTPFLSKRVHEAGVVLFGMLMAIPIVITVHHFVGNFEVGYLLATLLAAFGLPIAVIALNLFRTDTQLGQFNLMGDRLLVVRQPLDEASLVISLGALTSTILNKLMTLAKGLANVVDLVARLLPRWLSVGLMTLVIIGMAMGTAVIFSSVSRMNPETCVSRMYDFWIGVGYVLVGVSLEGYIINKKWGATSVLFGTSILLAPFSLPIYLLASLAVGLDSILTQPIYIHGAEATPNGPCQVACIEDQDWTRDSLFKLGSIMEGRWSLAHSSYDNRVLAEAVCAWVKERCPNLSTRPIRANS